jgi:hypothetical protein
MTKAQMMNTSFASFLLCFIASGVAEAVVAA